MLPSGLESIPQEILQLICGYLDTNSLYAFALASKLCQSTSNVLRFRKIHLTIFSPKQLELDVDRWSRTLERASSFKNVRLLGIEGSIRPYKVDCGVLDTTTNAEPATVDYDSDGELSSWMDRSNSMMYDPSLRVPLVEDDAWRPLANFIRQLPVLADLVYACSNQFPPCLLDELHRNHPVCRLHIRILYFRNLNEHYTDSHELALATSPCLHSISTFYNIFDGNEERDFHGEAVLRTVSVLAPKLKELSMFRGIIAFSIDFASALENSGQQLRGLLPDKHKAVIRPRSLAKLALRGHGFMTQHELENWNKLIDFSTLRTLILEITLEDEAFSWAVTNCTFHCLTSLIIEELPTDDYDYVSNSFFRSLPPLTKLKVGHLSEGVFKAILEQHGKSLRQLWLSSFSKNIKQFAFKSGRVARIQQYCPNLEDLTLHIPRSKGDAQELAIYKTLGALPKLQKLFLTLESSNLSIIRNDDREVPDDSSFDEFDRQLFPFLSTIWLDRFNTMEISKLRNGHVRDALINSALDETLARAIFQSISSSKARNALPLEHLKLRMTGGSQFGQCGSAPSGLAEVILAMRRSWLLVRNSRDDCREEVIARELDCQKWRMYERRHSLIPLHQSIEPVFRKIWPERQDGTGDWRDDWYSWPLSDS